MTTPHHQPELKLTATVQLTRLLDSSMFKCACYCAGSSLASALQNRCAAVPLSSSACCLSCCGCAACSPLRRMGIVAPHGGPWGWGGPGALSLCRQQPGQRLTEQMCCCAIVLHSLLPQLPQLCLLLSTEAACTRPQHLADPYGSQCAGPVATLSCTDGHAHAL